MTAIALESRFSTLTQVVRRRLLPVPGKVRVQVGDRVEADDIVAEATVEGRLHVIDLARELGTGAPDVLRHVRVSSGQAVERDTVLASIRPFGLLRKVVRAPFAGVIKRIEEGYLFLRSDPQTLLLRAYVPGEVVEHYPHRGVAVRAIGAHVRGVWGCGDERQGMLATMVSAPDEPLTWERVSLRYRGAVIVGGMLDDSRAVYRAHQFGLHGLVVGSILPELRPICKEIGLPVVVTEGMGRIPMAEPVFALLQSYHGRQAVIAGETPEAGTEIIIPLREADTTAVTVAPARPVEMGMRVRIIRQPYLGMIGQIVDQPPAPQETAIGTETEGAEVRLADGQIVFVPYVNMEPLD
ncbi:MAG: hypothetical protein ACOX9A_15125 [Anaerolineae bacterium]|jgi:hypothetical protein